MNPQSQNPIANGGAVVDAEATLRLIAALPAPAGLEDRVHAALGSAARQTRKPGRVLAWSVPTGSGGPSSGWMRSAAAAAIAFVVAGGGWGVYSRVQTLQPARLIPMPAQVAAPGGFAGAGAIRTPQTLNGPVLTHPVKAHAAPAKTAKKAAAKNAVVRKAAATDAH
jgi:hypothetical protein